MLFVPKRTKYAIRENSGSFIDGFRFSNVDGKQSSQNDGEKEEME